jgi:hypothetical protein
MQTVVRAGFGVSYVPFVDNSYAYNYPIKTSTFYTITPTYGSALNPAGGLVNFTTGIPATPTVDFASDGTLTESAGNGTIGLANLYIPLNFKNAYVSSWNVALQQALPKDMSLQIAYVANHGTRIDVAQNINQPTVYGQSAAYDPLKIAFGKTAAVTEYFLGYSTNYESLQVQLSRRFTHGLAFSSAFTWGKAQNYQTGAQDGATCSSGLALCIATTVSRTSTVRATSSRPPPTNCPPDMGTDTSIRAQWRMHWADGGSRPSSPLCLGLPFHYHDQQCDLRELRRP